MKNHQQVATATHMDLVDTATSFKKCIKEKTPANDFAGVFSLEEDLKINLREKQISRSQQLPG
jgi:hypothetical protein